MFNNKLLSRSAKPCTHIIIPFYRGNTRPGSCGWQRNRPEEGSFTPDMLGNSYVIAIYSYENGAATSIMLYPELPFNSIKLTRLDTNKSIILPPVKREYYVRTGFFIAKMSEKKLSLTLNLNNY